MKRCNELGMIPLSMGIDTWAVDFVLLDQNDQVLGNAVAYRDKRTQKLHKKYINIFLQKNYMSEQEFKCKILIVYTSYIPFRKQPLLYGTS